MANKQNTIQSLKAAKAEGRRISMLAGLFLLFMKSSKELKSAAMSE